MTTSTTNNNNNNNDNDDDMIAIDSGVCVRCGQYAAEHYSPATPQSLYLDRDIRGENVCRICMLEERLQDLEKLLERSITSLEKEIERLYERQELMK
jgi:hypothetical protein